MRQLLQQNNQARKVMYAVLVLMLCVGVARASDVPSQLTEYLVEEKANLSIATHERPLWTSPKDHQKLLVDVHQIEQLLPLIQAKIAIFEQFMLNHQAKQHDLSNQLKRIQQASLGHADDQATMARVHRINVLRDENNQTIELIKEDLVLARQYHLTLLTESHKLLLWDTEQKTRDTLNRAHEKLIQLDQERTVLYKKNIALERQKKAALLFHESSLISEETLFLNNQSILLIDDAITALQWQIKIAQAERQLVDKQDINTLESLIALDEQAIHQFERMSIAHTNMLAHFSCKRPILAAAQLKQACLSLETKIRLRGEVLHQDLLVLKQELSHKQVRLRKQLASRQSLSEYSWAAWLGIGQELKQIPLQLYHDVAALIVYVSDQYKWHDAWLTVLFWMSAVLLVLVAVFLHRLLSRVTQDKARSRLSAHLYDGLLVLIYRNIPQLTFCLLVLFTLFLYQVPYAHDRLLIHLMLVWFFCRQFLLIARLTLLERLSDVSGHDVRLYHRLRGLLLTGAWSFGLMIFSHELPLSFLLQDLFDWLFTLFLLMVSLVMWQSRDALPHLWSSSLTNSKPHVRHVISLLSLLVPITLLTTALIGLVGYINLAWTLSRYQVYFLVVVTGYVLMRGLVRDGLDLFSEWMVSELHNGWLWVEAVLKPVDKLLRIGLVFVSTLIFLQWIGISFNPTLVTGALTIGHYVLINWAGAYITLLSFAEFIVLLFIFIWASKWTREFCYRWLYAHMTDPGIRNSFAVFTQYSVVLLGCFVTLRVLGIDFTGMMVVLGGLAVGMGFGLRDFASNIVGGLMLLIERPVREGDLITIGEHEGRVAHIGIRSMRVSSWDNMEVLVPNAETFNKPFTNWTHQDSVVRTVLPIKVSRADDPVVIQQLIHHVLTMIPEILSAPVPQVFLKQIDEALIEFEVRYFINVQLHTRFEIRSKALLAIMAQFKAAGIKPPIPPLSVALNTHIED